MEKEAGRSLPSRWVNSRTPEPTVHSVVGHRAGWGHGWNRQRGPRTQPSGQCARWAPALRMLSPTSWSCEEAFRWGWPVANAQDMLIARYLLQVTALPLAIPGCVHLHTCVCKRTHTLHRSLEGRAQCCATPRCKRVTRRGSR